MAEEEDDYMSDKFLSEGAESSVRPGLLFTNKQRRELEIFKKKQETDRPFKEIVEEKTKQGLNTAIPETNKGFELLKKMGYKPGKGMGKSEDGCSAPIGLDIKEDKSGLGLKTHIQEKQKILKQTSFSAYRSTIKKRKELSDLKYDYGRLQRACQLFDEEDDLKAPIKKWFWPIRFNDDDEKDESEDKEDEEDTDDNDSDQEQKKSLDQLTLDDLTWRTGQIAMYLREKYTFCLWCGCKFDDDKDMDECCPGRTRQLHEEHEDNTTATPDHE